MWHIIDVGSKKPHFNKPTGVNMSETTYFTDNHAISLTLRDYFAAQSIQTAMQMVKHDLKQDDENFYWNEVHREIIAKRSYQLADAMLEARGE
jgi:hypothetical protein